MRHVPIAFSLAFAACVVGGEARAGDEPDARAAAAARTATIAADFPEPSAKAAYTWDAEFYVGDARVGDSKLAASPAVLDGKPVWKATEEANVQVAALKLTYRLAMTLGKDGGLRSSEASMEQDGQEPRRVSAQRTEDGLHVSTTIGTADPEVADVKTDPLTFCPLASVLLFLRQAPAEPAAYAFESFNASDGTLRAAALEVKGPGTWTRGEKPVDTWWALAHLRGHEMEIHLSPQREILVVFDRGDGSVIAKPGLVKTAARGVPKPATSAKEAAVRYTIGLNTADLDMLVGSIHFPTLYAEAKTLGSRMLESDFRAQTVASLTSSMKHMRLAEAEPIVKASADAGVETVDGDAVLFVFGGDLKGLEFRVKHFDDGWYVVRMPGR